MNISNYKKKSYTFMIQINIKILSDVVIGSLKFKECLIWKHDLIGVIDHQTTTSYTCDRCNLTYMKNFIKK